MRSAAADARGHSTKGTTLSKSSQGRGAARAAATAGALVVAAALGGPAASATPRADAAAAVRAADSSGPQDSPAAKGDPHRAAIADPHLGPVHPHTLSPAVEDVESCGQPDRTAWGWIGAGSDAPGAVTVNATVSNPAGTELRSFVRLTDYSLPDSPVVASGYSGATASGAVASFTVPAQVIKDGHAYGFSVRATGLTGPAHQSAAGPVCHFLVDLTPPTLGLPAQVDDPAHQFPPSGNGQSTGLHVGQSGTIPVTVTDADPSGLGASGVACVRWGFDPQFADAVWKCGSELPAGALTVTPTHWGTVTTYIQVTDNAGNHSPAAAYSYYVPDRPAPTPAYGDLTGDGVPDVLTADTAGNLRTFTAAGPSTLAAAAVQGPERTWTDVQVTHRASVVGFPVDAVFAHRTGAAALYVYGNPGNTGAYGKVDSSTYQDKPACVEPDGAPGYCTGYAADFSTTTSIAATGGISLPGYTPQAGALNRPGLLTVEANAAGTDAALWFYPSEYSGLGTPVRLAAAGWKDVDLITPGDWAGQGRPGLWARDRATGDLHALTFSLGWFPLSDGFDGVVLDEYGNPVTVPAFTAIASDTVIGNVPVSQWPVIGSEGDLTGNGSPALWGVTPGGEVQVRAGHRAGTPAAPGFTFEPGVQVIGSTAPPAG